MNTESHTWQEWAHRCGDLIMDPDGFDRQNPEKLYTYSEYRAGLWHCTISLKRQQHPDELPSINPSHLPDPVRAASSRVMETVHPGNRLRMMMGLPLLANNCGPVGEPFCWVEIKDGAVVRRNIFDPFDGCTHSLRAAIHNDQVVAVATPYPEEILPAPPAPECCRVSKCPRCGAEID